MNLHKLKNAAGLKRAHINISVEDIRLTVIAQVQHKTAAVFIVFEYCHSIFYAGNIVTYLSYLYDRMGYGLIDYIQMYKDID